MHDHPSVRRRLCRRLPDITARAIFISSLLIVGASPSAATSPSAAVGFLVAVRGQALVDGDRFTINDGAGLTTTFEFDNNGSVTPGNVAITISVSDNAAQTRNKIINAINAEPLAVTATNGSAGAAVALVNDNPGPAGNVPLFEAVAAPEFVIWGMAPDPGAPENASASGGIMTAIRASWLADGERFTVSDGTGQTMTFEFELDGAGTTDIPVVLSALDNANAVATKIRNAINATPLEVTASAGGAAVYLNNDHVGPAGNLPILENVAALEFTVFGMTGGSDGPVSVAPGARAGVRAFPNPFRATTLIELGAHAGRPGVLRVLDIHGSVIRAFAAPNGLPSQVRWDGMDARGQALAAGLYFYEIVSAGAPPATGRFIKLR